MPTSGPRRSTKGSYWNSTRVRPIDYRRNRRLEAREELRIPESSERRCRRPRRRRRAICGTAAPATPAQPASTGPARGGRKLVGASSQVTTRGSWNRDGWGAAASPRVCWCVCHEHGQVGRRRWRTGDWGLWLAFARVARR